MAGPTGCSNHDRSRLASRIGQAQTRVAAMLLLTLRGTPTLYQGDELGMADVPIPIDRVRDPLELNVPGLGLGRDPARTPMLWSDAPFAGFSSTEPWLPLSPHHAELNVSRQSHQAESLLNFYRALLALRRVEPALQDGDYVEIAVDERVLAYERRAGDRRLLIVLNMTAEPAVTVVDDGVVLLATHDRLPGEPLRDEIVLAAHQGLLMRLR